MYQHHAQAQVGKVDEQLRGVFAEPHHAVAVLEIEPEQRALPHLVEGQQEAVPLTPERVLHPRPPLGTDEAVGLHAQPHEIGAVERARVPGNANEGRGHRAAERARVLAHEGHEVRAPRDGLGAIVARAIEVLRRQGQTA